ncbi:single-stranded DNA-binding protein [Brevibacterium marinum]|uniref:Single-stranded DNA-binding protein n=1 Tax=Brevibacterium marinum TaxID=418643 RepID=A0A846SA87_9MICO|nr:single-stranded DNA-binding protein [Brevibacterium marinum]NJC57707.1 single-strand DNA-binding protein [Brevibacterium marinum]
MSIIPINLSGTLAADPQSRTLPSGRACASFRLAVNHWRLDKTTGEYSADTTSWFGVDCYGPLAGNCSMSLRQGMSVVVQGTLKIREWSTDEKSGIAPTVVAEHIGPDLRYGTANYQKANSANRQQNSQTQAESGSDSAWAGLDRDGAGPLPTAGDGSGIDIQVESGATESEADANAEGGESGDVDEAVVADTVRAAAPF